MGCSTDGRAGYERAPPCLAIVKATERERGLVQAQKTIKADLAALDARFAETRSESASDRDRRVDLRVALEQVDRGLPAEGALEVLAAFAGGPGLAETRKIIKALRVERAEWLHRRDHNDETKLYRLRPGYGSPRRRSPTVAWRDRAVVVARLQGDR